MMNGSDDNIDIFLVEANCLRGHKTVSPTPTILSIPTVLPTPTVFPTPTVLLTLTVCTYLRFRPYLWFCPHLNFCPHPQFCPHLLPLQRAPASNSLLGQSPATDPRALTSSLKPHHKIQELRVRCLQHNT